VSCILPEIVKLQQELLEAPGLASEAGLERETKFTMPFCQILKCLPIRAHLDPCVPCVWALFFESVSTCFNP